MESLIVAAAVGGLISLLNDLGQRVKQKSWVRAAKILVDKRELDRLSKSLVSVQADLNLALTHGVYNQAIASRLMQENIFTTLNELQQKFIRRLADGYDTLLAFMRQQTNDINTLLESMRQQTNDINADTEERHRENFLTSLAYSGMSNRKGQINKQHAQTFDWIFGEAQDLDYDRFNPDNLDIDGISIIDDDKTIDGNKSDKTDYNKSIDGSQTGTNGETSTASGTVTDFTGRYYARWDNFSAWLASTTEKLYWISGKPGSGKSTLMKFLSLNPRTIKCLEKSDNVGTMGPLILSFYMWGGGGPDSSVEQKSIHGLLCSLLCHLLRSDSSLIDDLMKQTDIFDIPPKNKRHSGHWSDYELQISLLHALKQSRRLVCIFIDGLDEIDRQTQKPEELIALIQNICDNAYVKVCISSRPETEFKKAYSRCPSLRLQDLTRRDIALMTDDLLRTMDFTHHGGEGSREEVIRYIVDNADGVFIWVGLALDIVKHTTNDNDPDDFEIYYSYKDLLVKLQKLPTDLKHLYDLTWKRNVIQEGDQDAELYFKLVLKGNSYGSNASVLEAGRPTSLFHIAVAYDKGLQKDILEKKRIPLRKIMTRIDDTRKSINSCCRGFLEVRDTAFNTSNDDIDLSNELGDSYLGDMFNRFLMPLGACTANYPFDSQAVPSGSNLNKLWRSVYHTRVEFIHRTAADFVTSSGDILQRNYAREEEITVSIARSRLVQDAFFRLSHDAYRTENFINFIKPLSAEAQRPLLGLLGQTCQRWLDMVPAMENILNECNSQLRQGDLEGNWAKILVDSVILNPGQFLLESVVKDAFFKEDMKTDITGLPEFKGILPYIQASLVACGSIQPTSVKPSNFREFKKIDDDDKEVDGEEDYDEEFDDDKTYDESSAEISHRLVPPCPPQNMQWPLEIPEEMYNGFPERPFIRVFSRFVTYLASTSWMLVNGRRSIRRHVIHVLGLDREIPKRIGKISEDMEEIYRSQKVDIAVDEEILEIAPRAVDGKSDENDAALVRLFNSLFPSSAWEGNLRMEALEYMDKIEDCLTAGGWDGTLLTVPNGNW
ncbi:hypothetical protein B0T17DRAFT_638980 [Bombardia bombarda]|uniref:NACHT domain-containing protein n=1 Tax=Bombardia bombarda TaxID=252184 RepID=A0AA39X0I7_9PEZI|nr:hypothetical protein B0T17DRAFT_638980 [Bombardia bombarda]